MSIVTNRGPRLIGGVAPSTPEDATGRVLWLDADRGVLGGGSRDFSGQTLSAPAVLSGRSAYTVLAWVRPDTLPSGATGAETATIYAEGSAGDAGLALMDVQPAGGLRCGVRASTGGATFTGVTSAGLLAPATTHLAACGYDGASVFASVDAASWASSALPGPIALDLATARIGGRAGQIRHLDGRVGTVVVLGRAPTAVDLAWWHNGGLGRRRDEVPADVAADLLRWVNFGSADLPTPILDRVTADLFAPEGTTYPAVAAPLSRDAEEWDNRTYALSMACRRTGRVFDLGGSGPATAAVRDPYPPRVPFGTTNAPAVAPGRTLSGRSAWTVGMQGRFLDDLTTGDDWTEVAADGSGIALGRDAGGFPYVRSFGPGGADEVRATCPDTIGGRYATAAGATGTATGGGTQFDLTIGAHRLQEGDYVFLSGTGTAHDNARVAVTKRGPTWVRVVAASATTIPPGSTLRASGHWQKANTTSVIVEEGHVLGLVVVRDGDTFSWYARRDLIGTATVEGLPAGPDGDDVATHLGGTTTTRHVGVWSLSLAEAWDSALAGDDLLQLQGRMGFLCTRRDGFLRVHSHLSMRNFPVRRREHLFAYRTCLDLLDAETRELVESWEDPGTGQGIARGTGPCLVRALGDRDTEEDREYVVRATVFSPTFTAAGDVEAAPEVEFCGDVATIRRRAKDATWRTYFASPGGNDADPGTSEGAPKATLAALWRLAGPRRDLRLDTAGTWTATGTAAMTSMVFGAFGGDLGPARTTVGPLAVGPYPGAEGRVAATWGPNGVVFDRAGRDIRLAGLDWSTAVNNGVGLAMNENISNVESPTTGCLVEEVEVDVGISSVDVVTGNISFNGNLAYCLLDRVRIAADPARSGAGMYFQNSSHHSAIIRLTDDSYTHDDTVHALRGHCWTEFEFGHVRRAAGPDTGKNQWSFRHHMQNCNAHDIRPDPGGAHRMFNNAGQTGSPQVAPRQTRIERASFTEITKDRYCGVAVHRCRSTTGNVGAGSVVEGGFYAARDNWGSANRSFTSPGSGFESYPTTGPYANLTGSGSGPPTAPAIELAEARGTVACLLSGPPVGGTGLPILEWYRRPSGGATWTRLVGAGAEYMADEPGPGAWEYRTRSVDEALAEAWGDAVVVAIG